MAYYMVAGLPYSAELYHHGIKGQKWGLRRFQQENGTLTSAGRERYADAIAKSAANASGSTKKSKTVINSINSNYNNYHNFNSKCYHYMECND